MIVATRDRAGVQPPAAKCRRYGFTIIELLVVISIIAVIATLATGAAIKSIKQLRHRRAESTKTILRLSLENYRALYGEWPCAFNNPDNSGGTFQTFKGEKNAEVFKNVFQAVKQNRALVDTSVLYTRVPQGRMTVKKALELNAQNIPVGYPNPKNTDEFIYYIVKYNFVTDSITVERNYDAEEDDRITPQ